MRRYLLLILIAATHLLSLDAAIDVRSAHYTTADGLANNTVRCMLQDSKGFLWFGTFNGLSRYDGNSFVYYRMEEGVLSLMDNHVQQMYEADSSFIWIKLVPERVSCYDMKAGRFVDFTGSGEYDHPFQNIMRASNGDVWLMHDRFGCRRVRRMGNKFTSLVFNEENGNLSTDKVLRVNEDSKGRIWIITTNGAELVDGDNTMPILKASSPQLLVSDKHLYFVSADGRVIGEQDGAMVEEACIPVSKVVVTGTILLNNNLYIFTSKGTFVYHPLTKKLEREVGTLAITNGEVHKDNRGNYWIYNNSGQVWYVNASTGVVKTFRLLPEDKMGYIDFERYRIVHDSRDIIWISTYGNGLFAYNLRTDELEHFAANMNGFSHIPSDYLLDVMEDRSGGIWVSGEYSGVTRITVLPDNATYIYPEIQSGVYDRSNLIRMLTCLDDGQVYAGTRRGGVYVYDKDLNLLRADKYNHNIYAVIRDADGCLWMGSRGDGLCIDDIWYRHEENDSTSLANNNVFCILRDRKGRKWIGTFNGGLDLAVKTGSGYTFRHFLNRTYNQSQIRCAGEDRNGYLWVGTSDGVYVFQPDSLIKNATAYHKYNRFNSGLPSNEVKSICVDRNGQVWIAASGGGLVMCRPGKNYDNLSFQRYVTGDGLVNNMAQAIVEDKDGRIWVSTEYGISCLHHGKFENFFFSPYVPGNTFCENSACVTHDGRVLFGSTYGLLAINPHKTNYNGMANPPEVTFTELRIDGVEVQPNEGHSPLSSSLAHTRELRLDYIQNSFEVRFTTFDYDEAGTVYMSRLDGFDKSWSTPTALNLVNYKNLPSGTYTLRVKACNSVGEWSDRETTLRIIIAPPFWKSAWAYALYFMVAALILFFLLRMLRKLNALRNRIEVERQLTEYKLVFFTNISHEFRTPLTLIRGALEKIEENLDDREVVMHSLETLDKSTRRMLRLINQLLEFRKMQNNKLALSLEETDVIAFLREIFLSFRDAAQSKNMDFRFVSSAESYNMYIDKGNVDKVSYNLLSNALKYTPSGGKVTFSATVDAVRKVLVISVADNGVGVPKEKRGELFKRFMQSSFSGNSIGVGLHLTHELVSVHHGSITYSENDGGGSVFTVCLPTDAGVYRKEDFLVPNRLLLEEEAHHLKGVQLTDSSDALDLADTTALTGEVDPTACQIDASATDRRKILIIEDDNDVRQFLVEEIGRLYEVAAEADGKAGLELIRSFDADLIVCDVMMPGLSGFEVCARLKADFNTSHIPVILLTALGSEDKQLEGVQSGADAYVTKPFSPKLLLTKISKLIEQREVLRQKFSHDLSMQLPKLSTSDQDKEFAERLQIVFSKHMGNASLTIDDFAVMMKLGRTVFYKKVRGVTGYAPSEYMKVMRLKKAAEMLADSSLSISEISYNVGINDPLYFSKCFKQQFGITPSAYRRGEKKEQAK